MRILFHLVLTSLAVLVIARFVPGISVDTWTTAVLVAVVLGLLNIFVRPILYILTFPITILTLGLFAYILNATMLYFVHYFVPGFTVRGFIPAFIGALIITLVRAVARY